MAIKKQTETIQAEFEANNNVQDFSSFFDEQIPTLRLYVKAGPEGLWHTMQDDKPLYISQNQVTGRIEKLEIKTIEYSEAEAKKYKKDQAFKFRISILKDDNKRIIIQSGADTWFTKTLIPRLLVLSESDNFAKPISLGIYRSEPESNVVFAYLKQAGSVIKAGEHDLTDLQDIIDIVDILQARLLDYLLSFDVKTEVTK